MKGEEIIQLVEAHLGYTMPSPIRVVAEDWMRLKSQLALAESKLAIAVAELDRIYKICDKPWGVLTSRVWTVQDDDYEAWHIRDSIDETKAKIAEMK